MFRKWNLKQEVPVTRLAALPIAIIISGYIMTE
jgi:hypothetical protein